jgi:Flp pilus assembly protein TadG
MKNLASGHTTATNLATNIFDANYGNGAPTPTVTFPTDIYGDQQVQVSATVNVNTLFMRYLSNWRTVPVSDTAVATRGKLVMSIVLDRSGSMWRWECSVRIRERGRWRGSTAICRSDLRQYVR